MWYRQPRSGDNGDLAMGAGEVGIGSGGPPLLLSDRQAPHADLEAARNPCLFTLSPTTIKFRRFVTCEECQDLAFTFTLHLQLLRLRQAPRWSS